MLLRLWLDDEGTRAAGRQRAVSFADPFPVHLSSSFTEPVKFSDEACQDSLQEPVKFSDGTCQDSLQEPVKFFDGTCRVSLHHNKEYNKESNKENRKGSKKPDKPIRYQYGEYEKVLLSDGEAEKLKREYPDDWRQRIDWLSEYMASRGKRCQNHAQKTLHQRGTCRAVA